MSAASAITSQPSGELLVDNSHAISFETRPIVDLQLIKGIQFPAKVEFHQLLITGPPGSGKSSLVAKIGGWPQEGYLDLAARRWWANQQLGLRPREVHLGLPFVGCEESMSIFDEPWMKGKCGPDIDLNRIKLPPLKRLFFFQNWRDKFVFEFILPCAEWVYEQRKSRARRMTHRVDEYFDLPLVERQLETLWIVARYLAHRGFYVYVREGIEGELSAFTVEAEYEVPAS